MIITAAAKLIPVSHKCFTDIFSPLLFKYFSNCKVAIHVRYGVTTSDSTKTQFTTAHMTPQPQMTLACNAQRVSCENWEWKRYGQRKSAFSRVGKQHSFGIVFNREMPRPLENHLFSQCIFMQRIKIFFYWPYQMGLFCCTHNYNQVYSCSFLYLLTHCTELLGFFACWRLIFVRTTQRNNNEMLVNLAKFLPHR